MNRLEELIKEKCPNGVEFKKVENVTTRLKGSPITANQMKQMRVNNGKIRIFAGGQTMIDTDEKFVENFTIYNIPSVIVKSRGIIDFEYYDKQFTFKQEMWAYIGKENIILTKFLYYILQTKINFLRKKSSVMGSMPQIKLSDTDKILIPVPPIEIQQEIVRILDNFIELSEQLSKELKARQKQYEYYRNELLSYGNKYVNDKKIEYIKLMDIAEIGTGSSNTNEELENGKYPFFVRSPKIRYKNEYEYNEKAIITSGDGVGVGKIFHLVNGKYALHQRAYRIHIIDERFSTEFVYYYMKTKFYKYIIERSFHSSVTSVRRPMLNEFLIPYMSIEEQKRIVNILERFDKLCNDISSGLPAEIEARRKQYEYYRNKLLTFKELKTV